jgi:hypothetical protein
MTNIGYFLEDRGNPREINLHDRLRIGEVNSDKVREMTVEDYLKNPPPEFSGQTPAQRLKQLTGAFSNLTTPSGPLKVGSDVRKTVEDAERDRKFALRWDRLGKALTDLNSDWQGYFEDLDKAGGETPELKLRNARLQARTVDLNRRVETMEKRHVRETLVRQIEGELGINLDNRSIRWSPNTKPLRIEARDRDDPKRFHFIEIAPSGEARHTWVRVKDTELERGK